jgi:hypothetical protein
MVRDFQGAPAAKEQPSGAVAANLHAYFHSGWAFFVPYLVFYLVFFAGNLPVNRGWLCLRHIYLALHVAHALLAAVALRHSWRGGSGAECRAKFFSVLPWLCLGALCWLPGVYREYPADAWAHLARIDEWGSIGHVGDHSTPLKFSYFFISTFVGPAGASFGDGLGLRACWVGLCLLLCWQYFQLGRSVGLERRGALGFVVLQFVLLGNNAFGFYRYYGISSSLLALLGAVGFVRTAVWTFAPDRLTVKGTGRWRAVLSLALLLALIACNHAQGLAWAGIGLLAVLLWRVTRRYRHAPAWVGLGLVLLSILAVQYLPRHPALDADFRPQGMLTPWYGFNLLVPWSPAAAHTLIILGIAGLLNFLAALYLMFRNQLTGWLTVLPAILLAFPAAAVPLANALAMRDPNEVGTFHRVLLAAPAGLALIVVARELAQHARFDARPLFGPTFKAVLLCAGVALLCLVPGDYPFHNRFFHAIMVPPHDLVLRYPAEVKRPIEAMRGARSKPAVIVLPGLAYRLEPEAGWKLAGYSLGQAQPVENLLAFARDRPPAMIPRIDPKMLYSPASPMAQLSGHWLPQRVAWQYMGNLELPGLARSQGFRATTEPAGWVFGWEW